MAAVTRNLQIEQGVDWDESFQILDAAGTPIDLVGFSIQGHARLGQLSTDPLAFSFSFNINTAEKRIYVSLARATTSALVLGPTKSDAKSIFYYDYELTNPLNKVSRIQQGKVFMLREITRP